MLGRVMGWMRRVRGVLGWVMGVDEVGQGGAGVGEWNG